MGRWGRTEERRLVNPSHPHRMGCHRKERGQRDGKLCWTEKPCLRLPRRLPTSPAQHGDVGHGQEQRRRSMLQSALQSREGPGGCGPWS